MRRYRQFRTFDDVESLRGALGNDASETDRFPARFILVEGIVRWRGVLALLRAQADKVVYLSQKCKGEDVLPYLPRETLPELLDTSAKGKTLLVPLGEVLRLREELGAEILTGLALLQNVGLKRIYIPLFQCADIFERVMNGVSRWQSGTLPAGWILKGRSDSLKLTITPLEIQIREDCRRVMGLKSYLELWERGGPDERHVYLATESAQVCADCLGTIEVEACKDNYESVVKNLTGAQSIEMSWGTESQWAWLAGKIVAGEDFVAAASRLLNLRTYDFWKILSGWEHLGPREKWLFWLWTKLERPGRFVKAVFEADRGFEDFEEAVITHVFSKDCVKDDDMLKERRNVLRQLSVRRMPISFWEQWDRLDDSLVKLRTLTGLTRKEQEEAFLITKMLLDKGWEVDDLLSHLDLAYQELAFYLTPSIPPGQGLLARYFKFYNVSRVLDRPTRKLSEAAEQALKENLIFQFSSTNMILEKLGRESAVEIWIDGMGLEWLGIITGCFRQLEHIEIQVDIARTNLPSVTSANKSWSENAILRRELDSTAHRYDYQHPSTLVRQISIVQECVNYAISCLEHSSRVIIASDHGLSRYTFNQSLCLEIPEGAKVHKWGRCAEVAHITDELASCKDWIFENGWICLARHGRFKGGKGATGEVHGGAALEEILVPVIQISRKAVSQEVIFSFNILDPEIRLGVKGVGKLENVKVYPDPGELILRTRDNRVFRGRRIREGKYMFVIDGLRPGECRAWLESGSTNLGEVSLRVVSGALEEEDLGI